MGLMLVLSHPEKLRYLECQEINAGLRAFVNLEQVVAQQVKLDFHLSNNPTLKKIDLCFDPRSFFQESNESNEYYQNIRSLIDQQIILGLNDLEITNFGIQADQSQLTAMWMPRMSDPRDFFVLGENEISYLVRNYSLFEVDHIPWRFCVFYPNSMQYHRHLSECLSKLNIIYYKSD